MRRDSLRGSVDFHQDEPRGIVRPLHHVEARNPRFFHAVAGVINRGSLERLDLIGLDMYVYVNGEHGLIIACGV
jgi:hypothetical protein